MAVIISLPADVEQRLRAENPDLDIDVREALLIELYRQSKLTRFDLAQALGISRMETDAVLSKHNVTEDLPCPDELKEDLRIARGIFKG